MSCLFVPGLTWYQTKGGNLGCLSGMTIRSALGLTAMPEHCQVRSECSITRNICTDIYCKWTTNNLLPLRTTHSLWCKSCAVNPPVMNVIIFCFVFFLVKQFIIFKDVVCDAVKLYCADIPPHANWSSCSCKSYTVQYLWNYVRNSLKGVFLQGNK